MTATTTPSRPITDRINFGRRVIRVQTSAFSWRVDTRFVFVGLILGAACIGLGITGMMLGDLGLSASQVVGAFLGEGDKFDRTVVLEWRLPRVVAAIVLGAALGVSGAIFQGLTQNPLGSPDIIGFTQGSYTGGVTAILVFGASSYTVAGGAVAGGLITALFVYLLAWRGGIDGFRLILVGVGISAMLAALSQYLIMRAELDDALNAAAWGVGTLSGTTWSLGLPMCLLAGVCLVATVPLLHALRHMELGDDRAASLGVSLERVRVVLVILGVVLVASVTALAGPITFVALVAPQVGRRLVRAGGMSLPAAAMTGAVMLLACDVIANHALSTPLPVGVVTLTVGGGYLVWLLVMETRRRLA